MARLQIGRLALVLCGLVFVAGCEENSDILIWELDQQGGRGWLAKPAWCTPGCTPEGPQKGTTV